ncbi:MAG: hypothetical protein IJO68_07295 [Clostridia bacterium]|nr:hypothetical protein [Clostridia bacterium]
MLKTKKDAGADNLTPSVPQYFSWVNNTNEGSTEEQTLINLDFFRYMKEVYGMEIRIYAWDAGNFDGASEGYGNINGEKFRSQYPDEYYKVVEKARESGIRMGLWGSPDGFGDDEKTENERFEFFVHLCREHNFALFKLDGVCGHLRPEKAELFAEMLRECRKYSPDLIVLNHRLELFEAEKHVTTYLWNGTETYVDVSTCNSNTCMHHRGFMFERGHTNELERLAEDHGVCISSCIDYFEDELIYQAFNRSLILAPETYGNPWLMRDSELPKFARVYNLHKRNADILVSGIKLPESYGANAVSRGIATKRFISTGNNSWVEKKIKISLSEETGLATDKKIEVNIHHPYEKHLGVFSYGDEVEITLMPFRAVLIEMAVPEEAEPVLIGAEYEIIKESTDGTPEEVKILYSDGKDILLRKNGKESFFMKGEKTDKKEKAPKKLGTLNNAPESIADGEFLYENAMFAITNDCLEKRSLLRSGDTLIPEVKAARDAFFSQKTYKLRGLEAENIFDGRDDTFFDSQSKTYCDNDLRINGGCLRVDTGSIYECDHIEIEFFASDTPTREVEIQSVPLKAEISCDLRSWETSENVKLTEKKKDTQEIVKFTVHTTYPLKGRRLVASYPVNGSLRYIRIAKPVDRIFAVRLIKEGKEIKLLSPKANNMQAHFSYKKTRAVHSAEFTLPDYTGLRRLTVAVEGVHGAEGVYCIAEADGQFFGFPERAPEYKANQWEHRVIDSDKNNTFFLTLPDCLEGKKIKIYAVFSDGSKARECTCDVYLSPEHI